MEVGLILVVVVALLAIAIGVAIVYRKVRKIDVRLYGLERQMAAVHSESRHLYRQLEALTGLRQLLALKYPLPPLRGWAASPDMLLELASYILSHKPGIILECSSGSSTLVAARCLQLIGAGHVYSLEHDAKYLAKTQALLDRHGLSQHATLIHAPLESRDGVSWYSSEAIRSAALPPVELLVVDGPPADRDPDARSPAMDRLWEHLASSFTVFVDDTIRDNECRMADAWQEQRGLSREDVSPCEKGLIVLRGTRRAD